MNSGFCGGAEDNFRNIQESLSFYHTSKLTLYASEMCGFVYFLFNAPQSCTSISKRGGTATDRDWEAPLDVKYRLHLA